MAEKLLKLSTLAPERPIIEIDGKLYHLKAPEDLGPRDGAFLRRAQETFESLHGAYENGNASEEQATDLEDLINSFVDRLAYDIPAEIMDALQFTQKVDVLGFFLASIEKHAGKQKTFERKKETGAS